MVLVPLFIISLGTTPRMAAPNAPSPPITDQPDFMHPALPSEDRLVRALVGQQQADFTVLYEAYAPALYGQLCRMVNDAAQAEDLLQDTFVKIWLNSHRYDPQQGRLFTWMTTIARHVAFDELRARKSRPQIESMLSSVQPTGWAVQPTSLAGLSQEALLRPLAPQYQVVMELMYYQQCTGQEVADRLKIPLGTVKTRIRIALQQLQALFHQDICHYQGTIARS
jgi:RNA polymerase sigma factor (sigma-70 family)